MDVFVECLKKKKLSVWFCPECYYVFEVHETARLPAFCDKCEQGSTPFKELKVDAVSRKDLSLALESKIKKLEKDLKEREKTDWDEWAEIWEMGYKIAKLEDIKWLELCVKEAKK